MRSWPNPSLPWRQRNDGTQRLHRLGLKRQRPLRLDGLEGVHHSRRSLLSRLMRNVELTTTPQRIEVVRSRLHHRASLRQILRVIV